MTKLLHRLADYARLGLKLSGIIYMHRIIDPRIRGTARSSMNMFRRLCGPDYFANVVLGTTFWNEIDISLGAQRERELCDNDDFWGQFCKNGSKVYRVGYSIQTDQNMVLKMVQNKKLFLKAQVEMQTGTSISETSAAREVNKDISGWAQHLKQLVEKERLNCQQELDQHENQWRQDFNARKAAILQEQQRREEADEHEQEEEEEKRQAGQARQQTEAARQKKHLEAQQEELLKRQRLEEQRRVRLEEMTVECRRKRRPSHDIQCDRCKRYVKAKREPFYRTFNLTSSCCNNMCCFASEHIF